MIRRVMKTGPDVLELGQIIDIAIKKDEIEYHKGKIKMICGIMHRFGEFVLIPTAHFHNQAYAVETEERRMFYVFEAFGTIKVVDLDVDNRIAFDCTVNGYKWSDV